MKEITFDFSSLEGAINGFAELVKWFAQMIRDFVNSWKKGFFFGEDE